MNRTENNIEKITAEETDSYSTDDIFNFSSWGADLSFRELIDRYRDNELVKPELQRKYIWSKPEASRFIDSILSNLPIPSIFLAKQRDETTLIIDGYQRIMTVYDYVRGIYSPDGKTFKLSSSSKVNQRWRGKAFNELTEAEQRRIKNTTIHTIYFIQTHPKNNNTGMHQIFERINTTGRTLLAQEIRNCVNQGPLNSLLFKLNEYPSWRALFGQSEPNSRMRDLEFILRYTAMRSKNFKKEKATSISLKQFLDEFMNAHVNDQGDTLSHFETDFKKTIDEIFRLFGEHAFNNISKTTRAHFTNKFNPTIFDSIAIATGMFLDSNNALPKHDFKKQREYLLNDNTYQHAIRYHTTNTEQINLRFSLALKYLYGLSYEQY